MNKTITLTTDFGLSDPWVGAMKGVILSINPDVSVVDISHGINPQNISEAGFVLSLACPYFDEGTVHVAVVDPGVGGKRRAILIETYRYFFIGPDNGIFSFVLDGRNSGELGEVRRVIELENKEFYRKGQKGTTSSTFHGRDIFAPVAAHVALGVDPAQMGCVINNPIILDTPQPTVTDDTLTGIVLYIDSFGNLITNISEALLDDLMNNAALGKNLPEFKVKGVVTRGLRRNYIQDETRDRGEDGSVPFALVGSGGNIEFALYRASAEKLLNARVGIKVTVRAISETNRRSETSGKTRGTRDKTRGIK